MNPKSGRLRTAEVYTRYYFAGGQYEKTVQGSAVKTILYLDGSPYEAAVALETNAGVPRLLYISRDHLGSITHITDANKTLQAEYSYDAWGRMRNPVNLTVYAPGAEPALLLNRGYTGHEHLKEFGLINMNARLYDALVGRMISPDNYVQDPLDPRNFNRYAYAMNNPLAYVDIDGNNPLLIVAIIIGAISGGYTGYKIAEANGYDFGNWQTYGYIIGGAIIGAASGYTGAGIAAGGGFMANTFSIMYSSSFFSLGMTALSGGSIPPSISFGAASYNFGTGEWGYLGKKGNSLLADIGYGFGALANIQDAFAGFRGTSVEVKSRPKLAGHSQVEGKHITGYDASGNPIYGDILISVGPSDHSIGQGFGLNWEMEYVKRTLQGNSVNGENVAYIASNHPQIVTKLNNVNGKMLYKMTNSLNLGRNLLNTGILKYGLLYGCVNYTSRALFFSGVLNVNALLPVTSPVLLNAEMALRNVGMLASSYLVNF